MKMINKFTALFITLFLWVNLAFANTTPITITQVVEQNKSNTNILQIHFTANQYLVDNWQLGLSMLLVFNNPKYKLSYKICREDDENSCQAMMLLANDIPRSLADVEKLDLTTGHTAIFKSAFLYPLEFGGKYVFQVDNLPYLAKNISMLPHGIFIINGQNQVLPATATMNYSVVGYPEQALLEQHQKDIASRIQPRQLSFKSEIVPRPQSIIYTESSFTLTGNVSFATKLESNDLPTINLFKGLLIDKKIMINSNSQRSVQLLACSNNPDLCSKFINNNEGYRIDITPDSIKIYSFTPTGYFYAYQTLKQLFFLNQIQLASQSIIDYPSYPYRGIMLDTVRHFFDIQQLEEIIDVMAVQKLNTLHLHVADDDGWRVALQNYPLLTEKSSKRYQGYQLGASNLQDSASDIANRDHESYETAASDQEHFYSKSQINSLINYANERGITIIPEIELPGHARAMKKAYPEPLYDFASSNTHLSIQGYTDNILPIYNYEKNESFTNLINGVVKDTANLFSEHNPEISLSGDEIPSNAYASIGNTPAITHDFFATLANNLAGYKISGWQQLVINDNGKFDSARILPNQVGHIWVWSPVANNGGVSALEITQKLLDKNYPVVANYADYAYLDMRYSPEFNEPGLYWATAFSDTYNTFSLGSVVLIFKNDHNFKGVEGSLWSELVAGNSHLWYMLLPKMTGIAEAGWSNAGDDSWQDFSTRLGCGNNGFMAYLQTIKPTNYRGYPNGINLEIPAGMCPMVKK